MNSTSWILCVILGSALTQEAKKETEEVFHVDEGQSLNKSRTLTPTNEIQTALQVIETLANGGQTLPFTTSLTDLKVGIIDVLSRFKLNPFTFFNAFITAWRNSLPTLAPLGNYTLLQLALVLTIGGLAAGAAVVAAEAFYFKTLHEEEQFHHQLRRDYDLYYGKNSRQSLAPPKGKPQRPVVTLPPNRFKPQSLKRSQRRNQRKNKNAGAQLEYYKKQQAAAAKAAAAAAKRQRGRRQVTVEPFTPMYPTIAPRPPYISVSRHHEIPPPRRRATAVSYQPYPSQRRPPLLPGQESENMFSLKFISNFIRRHSSGLMKYLPSIPGFGGNSISPNNKFPPNRKQFTPESIYPMKHGQNPRNAFVRPALNSKKNMISRAFSRIRKNR